eukprot:9483314-Pyramimonas_sp.AAC.1
MQPSPKKASPKVPARGRVEGNGLDMLDRNVGPQVHGRVARSAPDTGRRGAGLGSARPSQTSEDANVSS